VLIKLAYGKSGLTVDFPDNMDITVLNPKYIPGMGDTQSDVLQALRAPIASPPLYDFVKPSDKIGIVVNDITRPTPYHNLLPSVLHELERVPAENITFSIALGTHREDSQGEVREILGDEIVDNYRVVQNNAFDPNTQVSLGMTSQGHAIWLNSELTECDVKILTGFIEPHFFAGFSGGGKAVMPGMAGLETILNNHSASMVDKPGARWGVTRGNPIWEEIHEIALKMGRVFLLNVALNSNKKITGIFTGDLSHAHARGCESVKSSAMVPVERSFDIVITSNSGYPLDLNLYQSVKGMGAAAQVVRKGGVIIIAADCWDGIPEHGLYGKLLRESKNPQELLDRIRKPGFLQHDQWSAHVQAKIQLKADVYVFSDNLTDKQIKSALLKPSHRIEDTVEEMLGKYGPHARICVLPEGPQTIPYIK
jgi:nickel-dependent lactate racemase